MEWFAVRSVGGRVAGAWAPVLTRLEAEYKLSRAQRDTATGGRYKTDLAVLASARVLGPFARYSEANGAVVGSAPGPRLIGRPRRAPGFRRLQLVLPAEVWALVEGLPGATTTERICAAIRLAAR